MKAAECHIRLIEFVLNTRLTVAQKSDFLQAIIQECYDMPTQDRKNFLSAAELAEAMNEMNENGLEAVKFVLKKDFDESARELQNDPAAALYLKLARNSANEIVKVSNNRITNQSFAALIEYLQFIANPDEPPQFGQIARKKLKHTVQTQYKKLSEDTRTCLNDFQLTWYMIRAGWQLRPEKQLQWAKKFATLGITASDLSSPTKLNQALSADFYGEILDEAVKGGAQPSEWSDGPVIW
jgi:hypothetical protein